MKVLRKCWLTLAKPIALELAKAPAIAPTLDKGQAAKIQEQENLLRAAVNVGEGNSCTCCHIQIVFIQDVLMLNSLF